MNYFPRVLDRELKKRLTASGAVLIEGPKACGKTETARQLAASEVLLDVEEDARVAAGVDPSLLLGAATPRLIDEWQIAPAIWNHVRREVDSRGQPGQFILTGSALPSDDETRHTGAGRITRLQMRPMTLFETGHSSGSVSLEALLAGERSRAAEAPLTINQIARLIAVGGWPAIQSLPVDDALRSTRSYLDEIRRVDVNRVGRQRRDPLKLERLLRSLARNVATEVPVSRLAADAGGDAGPIKWDTASEYLDVLTRLKIVEPQHAWMPHMRSRYVLRSSPKQHFVDPSLAVAALRASPDKLLRDLNFMGFLFESMATRDLRVYSQMVDAEVYYYRDSDGLEIDAVVAAVDGRWAAFEVKLGQGYVDQAAANLLKFARRVDTSKVGDPGCLAVITGTGYSYLRDDGVSVIAIGALGP